jgi:hypothetical protein
MKRIALLVAASLAAKNAHAADPPTDRELIVGTAGCALVRDALARLRCFEGFAEDATARLTPAERGDAEAVARVLNGVAASAPAPPMTDAQRTIFLSGQAFAGRGRCELLVRLRNDGAEPLSFVGLNIEVVADGRTSLESFNFRDLGRLEAREETRALDRPCGPLMNFRVTSVPICTSGSVSFRDCLDHVHGRIQTPQGERPVFRAGP